MKHSWPPGLPPTLATGRLPFPPHTTKNLWQDPKVPERWPCLEARSLADDDPFRVRAAGRCVSSSHLLSDTSGYASTACRFCSGSTVTFPFSWWPDLCGQVGAHRGQLGALRTGMAPRKADSSRRSLWLAALQAVSIRRGRPLWGPRSVAQAQEDAQAKASGAGPAMSSSHHRRAPCVPTPTAKGKATPRPTRLLLFPLTGEAQASTQEVIVSSGSTCGCCRHRPPPAAPPTSSSFLPPLHPG